MSTQRILLAVSTSRYSRALVTHAMDEAERQRADGHDVVLHVVNVVEDEDLDRVASSVGSEGFLGLGPQRDVLAALGAEHNRMAQRRVDEVRAAAEARDIPVEVDAVEGTFGDVVLARAQEIQADVILITRAERPFISRILFGSEADRVARLARKEGLGRVIIDEGDGPR
jgi:nucleotide-binding universal stress UspA family protein